MKYLALSLLAALLVVPVAFAQTGDPMERLAVPFSQPDRPGKLIVSAPNAQVTVVGYDGQEAIIEARSGGGSEERVVDRDDKATGLRRLAQPGLGLEVTEDNNVMRVHLGWMGVGEDGSEIHIRVPRTTSLQLETLNGGDMLVEGVRGNHEINNLNGDVTMHDIDGSAVVSALNGDIEVTFTSVAPNTPMSFSSMNGDIDVTFPPNLQADFILKTEQGDIYTDFEMTMDRQTRTEVDDDRDDGVYRVQINNALHGTVGGGGPEIRLKTFNADIYIRQGR